MLSRFLTYLIPLAAVAQATQAPKYNGFDLVWQADFVGTAGTLPNTANWNIITGNLGVNAEMETYRSRAQEVQLSGGGTLQIVPWRDSTATNGWSSGRIESKYTFTPTASALTRVEALIRFGTNAPSAKQGLWPAFWMLGDSMRHGTVWPECGELDILETIDGQLTGHGTMHCDITPGGICDESTGIGSSISIPDQSWHTWRLELDRTNSNWEDQTITWYMDGKQFQQIAGSRIGSASVWTNLCHSPLYFILNMAVGGTWVC